VRTYAINIALNYKHIPCIEVARTNYFASSLDIFTGKTPVPSSSTLFARLSIDKMPYYNSGLSLNKSIDLTSIGL